MLDLVNKAFELCNSTVQLGFASFGTGVHEHFTLTESVQGLSVEEAVLDVAYNPGLRYTDQALKYVLEEAFSKDKGGRDNALDIVILITNGESTSPRDTRAEAALLAETDIKVIVVGVGNVNIDELRAIASKPEYLYTIDRFMRLGGVYLLEQLCRDPPPEISTDGCTLNPRYRDGAFSSAYIACVIDFMPHRALCDFYRTVDSDGAPIAMEKRIDYSYTEEDSGNSTLWRSNCTMNFRPEDLEPGTHNLMVHIYPDAQDGRLYGGPTLLDALPITLSFPEATHTCPPNLLDNFACGIETVCSCDLVEAGNPPGKAVWFSQEERLESSNLTISAESASGRQFTCEAVSELGQVFGSSLKFEGQCG